MAQYHNDAKRLAPKVLEANFTKGQLQLIHDMMRECSQLRQGKVISSFFECMLPEKFELRENSNNPVTYTRNGIERTFNPLIVLEKGEDLPPKTENQILEEKLIQAKETGII